MARVEVDRHKCSGHGECEAIAPSVFEVQDDGVTRALVETVPDEDLDVARQAVAACPTGALSLRE